MDSLPQEIQLAICQEAVLMQAARRRLQKWIGMDRPFLRHVGKARIL